MTSEQIKGYRSQLNRMRKQRDAARIEADRLRKVIATDAVRFDILVGRFRGCEKGTVSEGHPLSIREGKWWAEDCRAALAEEK